ncbi:MAG: CDP-alcohol phosphatidyltransferase family protein [Desulfocapsaceae bacterium]
MLDRFSLRILRPLLDSLAAYLQRTGIRADHVTIASFAVGLFGAMLIARHHYLLGGIFILLNRLGDGVDGVLARLSSTTDRGAFLDICLDFIFYSAVVLGFALAEPARNSLAAAFLIFSFVGTGSSFLAYAIMAERRSLTDQRLPDKGFYYLGGLAEGTETIVFFILICLFPSFFPALAWIFGSICLLGTAVRIVYGYKTLD